MSFLDLDLLNDQVLVDSFQPVLGDKFKHFETDVRQLVTLVAPLPSPSSLDIPTSIPYHFHPSI